MNNYLMSLRAIARQSITPPIEYDLPPLNLRGGKGGVIGIDCFTPQSGIRNDKGGFTLMELIVAVGIIGILAATGAAVFFRSLRGSSQTEIRQTLDGRVRLITSSLSRFFLEGKIVSLDSATRTNCLSSGQVSGSSLVVAGLDNLLSTISVDLISGQISSGSAVINPESVTVGHQGVLGYYFIWYCGNGVPDRLVMKFSATYLGQQGDTGVSGDYDIDVTMRNSGQ